MNVTVQFVPDFQGNLNVIELTVESFSYDRVRIKDATDVAKQCAVALLKYKGIEVPEALKPSQVSDLPISSLVADRIFTNTVWMLQDRNLQTGDDVWVKIGNTFRYSFQEAKAIGADFDNVLRHGNNSKRKDN